MRNCKSTVREFNLIGISDIDMMEIEELKELYKHVIYKLGKIQANINYCKKFKLNSNAQSDIIILNEDKKYYQMIKKKIEEELKRGGKRWVDLQLNSH